MYSLVLLTALSTGADVPAPAVTGPAVAAPVVASGCYGISSGCCGYAMSCNGCYGSCYGSCHGCHGSCHGCHGGLFSGGFCGHKSSCHGCSGYSCHGCSGGYSCGGGYPGYPYSSWSYGSSWGPPIGMPPYTMQGYNSVWGGVANPAAGVPVPNTTDKTSDMPKPVPPSDKKADKPTGMGAILKFRVPADTVLYFDGKMVDFVKGSERVFSTPPLPAGQKFFYDVRAERKVGGALIVQDMRVFVEAGATIEESMMDKLASADEKKPEAVAGK